MPTQRITGVDANRPGNSLAIWLASHHPDLFLAMFKKAQAERVASSAKLGGLRSLGRLGDDFEPSLQSISFDAGSISQLPSTFIADDGSTGTDFLTNVASSATSSGSTVGNVLSSVGTGILGALGSVGGYLTSSSGLNALTSLAKTYYSAQTSANNATTAQVLQTQISRAATNKVAAPVTYQNGVPVYATQTPTGTVYQQLTPAGISALGSSGLNVFLHQYGVWIAVAGAAVFALTRLRR